jgi:lambda family phage portal protein
MMPRVEIKANIIDRAIEYVAPLHAAKRFRARAMMALTGSYIGASKNRRPTKEWKTSSGDADSDIINDLPTLRERSRDLARNAPLAVGAISTCLTNVVGTGLKLQSRIDRDVLKLTDEQAEAWEAQAEREFRLWAESRECDRSRQMNFHTVQEVAFRQTLENGEIFTLLPRIERTGSPYKLKIHMVESDRVCNENNARNTETLVEGIEKDTDGAPMQYHILNQHPGSDIVTKNKYTWTKIPAFGTKTGLPNVIHLYRMLRPGQSRGVPYLAPVIESLKQLDRYTEAEIMAAVISAMFTVFIKTEKGDFPVPTFDNSGMGMETGAKSTDTDIKLASGAIVGLGRGEEISIANPSRPNSAFEPFVMAIMEQIGTALEIPYEIIIRHFSSSYSASRAALLEAWRFFRGRRFWLASNFCQPIYEVFLWDAIAAGRLSAPGFFTDYMIRKAYCGAIWQGDAPGYIDPARDIDAAEKRMSLGISPLDEETTLITGGDMEKNIPRIAQEIKMLNKAGMRHPAQGKPEQQPIVVKPVPSDDQVDEKGNLIEGEDK